MPLYEYHCLTCRHDFDRLRGAAQADVTQRCDECGSEQVERKLSVFAMRRTNASEQLGLTAASSAGCCGGTCGCGGQN